MDFVTYYYDLAIRNLKMKFEICFYGIELKNKKIMFLIRSYSYHL